MLAYLEAAAFIGLLVPGELTVVLGGAIARDGHISIVRLFLLVWFAAAAGDTTGYLLGHRLGREFLFRHGPRFHITPAVIARVEAIFDRHGGKAIILGRFIGVARAITPFLAGTSKLSFRRFLAFDIPGAGAWAAAFLAVGYLVATSADRAASLSHAIGLAIGGAVAVARRDPRHPAALPQRARRDARPLRAAVGTGRAGAGETTPSGPERAARGLD